MEDTTARFADGQGARSPDTSLGVKRKVEDNDDTNTLQAAKTQKTYKKYESYWVPDGNVFLQIGDTRFKLLKSRLAADSTWFSNLFGQREGTPLPTPYKHQNEIEKVLETVEDVDGIDLFFLDINDGHPDAKSFAQLLKAMNCGINYAYSRPMLEEVVNLYESAAFYVMTQYTDYAESYLKECFPDNPNILPALPCIDRAIQGVLLGRRHQLMHVLRPSFYDLARAGTSATANTNDQDTYGRAVHTHLKKLPLEDLITLLDLQKHLVLCWEHIFTRLSVKCDQCKKIHRIDGAIQVRHDFPHDPVLGIHHILSRAPFSTTHCQSSVPIAKNQLINGRSDIWEKINVWIAANGVS